MNEHPTSATSSLDLGPTPGQGPDGGPPPLPGPALTGPTSGQGPTDAGPVGPAPIDEGAPGTPPGGGSTAGSHRVFAVLRRSPVHRARDRGVLGGVCAGIARSTGLSVVAVRAIAAASVLLLGTGVGAYLLAWALLPNEDGSIHTEQALYEGRPRSLVILGLGAMALLGMLSWFFNSWPLLIGAGVVALVLLTKQGRPQAPHHPHD